MGSQRVRHNLVTEQQQQQQQTNTDDVSHILHVPGGRCRGWWVLRWIMRDRGSLEPARPFFLHWREGELLSGFGREADMPLQDSNLLFWVLGPLTKCPHFSSPLPLFLFSPPLEHFPAGLHLGHSAVFYGWKNTTRAVWTVKQANGFSFKEIEMCTNWPWNQLPPIAGLLA